MTDRQMVVHELEKSDMPSTGIARRVFVSAAPPVCIALIALLVVGGCDPSGSDTQPIELEDVLSLEIDRDALDPQRAGSEDAPRYEVLINRPAAPPVVELDLVDALGRPVAMQCSTCHSIREPNLSNRTPEDLITFHQRMPFAHGGVSCLSCHNPKNYDSLRLADGSSIAYPNVMTLCSQCHGPQARDYAHGAHGGMSGYWDLSRGSRMRNNCVDCHDPHVPAFPRMYPTFKPIDRFLTPPHDHDVTDPSDHE